VPEVQEGSILACREEGTSCAVDQEKLKETEQQTAALLLNNSCGCRCVMSKQQATELQLSIGQSSQALGLITN